MEEFLVRLTNVIHWIGFLSPFVIMTTINQCTFSVDGRH